MDSEDISTSHCHCFGTHHVFLSSRSRNPPNRITVNRLPFNKISNSLLSLCLLNSFTSVTPILSLLQRLRLTIKMTQFEQNFVQMDIIYWIMLALVGKEAVQLFCSGTCLQLKKRMGGLKVSLEFSEWTVQQASSHDLRVVIIYRLQSDSDDRRIPMNIFLLSLVTILKL